MGCRLAREIGKSCGTERVQEPGKIGARAAAPRGAVEPYAAGGRFGRLLSDRELLEPGIAPEDIRGLDVPMGARASYRRLASGAGVRLTTLAFTKPAMSS